LFENAHLHPIDAMIFTA